MTETLNPGATEYCVQCGDFGTPDEMVECEECGEQIHEACIDAHNDEHLREDES